MSSTNLQGSSAFCKSVSTMKARKVNFLVLSMEIILDKLQNNQEPMILSTCMIMGQQNYTQRRKMSSMSLSLCAIDVRKEILLSFNFLVMEHMKMI